MKSFQHEHTSSKEVQSYLNFSLLIINIIIQIMFNIEKHINKEIDFSYMYIYFDFILL